MAVEAFLENTLQTAWTVLRDRHKERGFVWAPGISIQGLAQHQVWTRLRRATVGPIRQIFACMCLEEREEKSQSSNINLQAKVTLTCFWSMCIVNQQDNLASAEGKSLFINCVSQNKTLSSLPGIHRALSNHKTDKNSEWGCLMLTGPSLCHSKDINCKPKSY